MTKLNDEIIERICEYVTLGLSYKDASEACDITERTFYNWKKRGENAKSGKHYDFLDKLKLASSKSKVYHLNKIREAGDKGVWQANAWILERRFPEEFGRRDKIQAEVEHKGLKGLADAFKK